MNSIPDILTIVATRFGWAVLHSLWQGLLLAVLMAMVLRAMRSRSAAARHGVCLLGMLALCTTIAATAFRTSTPRPAASLAPAANALVETTSAPLAESAADAPLAGGEETTPVASPIAPRLDFQLTPRWNEGLTVLVPWISALWFFGVLLLTIRHCGGWWRLRQWRLSGTPVDAKVARCFANLLDRFGLRPTARVLVSTDAFTPMLTGLVKPVVLLPARVLTGLGPAELEAILAHELAHLARRDSWANLAQVVVETVLFYHPVVWWLGRRAREEREHAADDLALRVCTDRRCYAGALARLAEIETEPVFALAATGGSLLTRIRRIVARPQPEPSTGVVLPALAGAMMLAVVVVAHANDPKTIDVPAGTSLQAAIDAAPAGAVLRLPAGEWKERIAITKSLTIEGAGWEKTVIKPDQPGPRVTPEAKAEFRKQFAPGITAEKSLQLSREWSARIEIPTVLVDDAEQVTLRGLRIGGVAPASQDEAGGDTLVVFRKTRATMSDCAVVGPFGNGIRITWGADVKIERSLVAALWSEGIIVFGRGGNPDIPPSRLHLVESEVRNVYHYGIQLLRDCDSTVIERCRISGTAWHGIRYDHASPTITGNAIFHHARSGIYASGKTAAQVRGNLFWKNEMSGISCWGENADTIEENTFASHLREALGVFGGSRPTARRNLFFGNVTAIACSGIAGRNGVTTAPGDPVLEANLFSDNKDILVVGKEKKPTPAGSLSDNPKFRDAAKLDFALLADSPARAAKIGVPEPLVLASPWPLLAEEKAIIPSGDSRSFEGWKSSGDAETAQASAGALVPPTDDLAQRKADLELRLATLLRDVEKTRARLDELAVRLPTLPLDPPRTLPKRIPEAADLFLDAFMAFQQAEKAMVAKDTRESRASYAKAITLLDSISKRWPEWNPSIVEHRRKKAMEGLAKLFPQ